MNIRVCPDCRGNKGRYLKPDERRVMRRVQMQNPTCTETPFYYETLPEFRPCPLCSGGGQVRCEAVEAKGGES